MITIYSSNLILRRIYDFKDLSIFPKTLYVYFFKLLFVELTFCSVRAPQPTPVHSTQNQRAYVWLSVPSSNLPKPFPSALNLQVHFAAITKRSSSSRFLTLTYELCERSGIGNKLFVRFPTHFTEYNRMRPISGQLYSITIYYKGHEICILPMWLRGHRCIWLSSKYVATIISILGYTYSSYTQLFVP